MGFGLIRAPATYAMAMDLILRRLTWKTMLAFFDDIVLGSRVSDQTMNLNESLQRLSRCGLKLEQMRVLSV